ncbi:S-layer homology domain-containing protein [Paenibacillus sp. PK4536]|uniref:S-layer homology domain-containing protein n=1 Tax=Paenibacillus sp. PK4536 TaxID=3024576 RepID=UPI002358E5DC|nr:S-layer homology domain-containing protein [Paenibacillus sp. PK4536]WIM38755.1 S-layer homology domain-containing protein [Paenibacillus sp. PK4536]
MRKFMMMFLVLVVTLMGSAPATLFASEEETSNLVASNEVISTPNFSLSGDYDITLKQGEPFIEEGWNVSDSVYSKDELKIDITYTLNSVPVSQIDTNIPGVYVITYVAENPAGKRSYPSKRTVDVVATANQNDIDQLNILSNLGMTYHNGSVYLAKGSSGISKVELSSGTVTSIVYGGYYADTIVTVAFNQAGDLFYTLENQAKINKVDAKYLQSSPLNSEELRNYSSIYLDLSDKAPAGQEPIENISNIAFDSQDQLYIANPVFYFDAVLYRWNQNSQQLEAIIQSDVENFQVMALDKNDNFYFNGNVSRPDFAKHGFFKIPADKLKQLPVSDDASELYRDIGSLYPNAKGMVFLPDGRGYYNDNGKIKAIYPRSKPIITLKGDYNPSLFVGDTYVEEGITVQDATYSEFTTKITYTLDSKPVDSLNTSIPGHYIIHYNATNPANVAALEVTRQVIVKPLPLSIEGLDIPHIVAMTAWKDHLYITNHEKGFYEVIKTSNGYKRSLLAATPLANAVAVDQHGNLFFTLYATHYIFKLDAQYLNRSTPLTQEELSILSQPYYHFTDEDRLYINGLAFDHQNQLYMSVTKNKISQILKMDGTTADTPKLVIDFPNQTNDIDVSPAGNLYINANNGYLFQAKSSSLTTLPLNINDLKEIKKNNDNSIVFLPDGTAYGSSFDRSFNGRPAIQKLDFTDPKQTVDVTGVTLSTSTLTINKKDQPVTLQATVAPVNATQADITWMSSNEKVALVKDGVVTPVAKGTAIIIATTVEGNFKATATVNVKESDDKNTNSSNTNGNSNVATNTSKSTVLSANNISSTTQISSANGQPQSSILFSTDKLQTEINKLQANNQKTATITIPNTANSLKMTMPQTALNSLNQANMNLDFNTEHVQLAIPTASLQSLKNDLQFQVIPLTSSTDQNAVKLRAQQQSLVKNVSKDGNITVVGTPMNIETNLQNQSVDLVMPVDTNAIPQNAIAKTEWLNQLRIFVEHSNGEHELIQPTVVNEANGQTGLKFTVTAFSTFTILDIPSPKLEATTPVPANLSTVSQNVYQAYIQGYSDQTFRPNQKVTRAEMASMLSRLSTHSTSEPSTTSYSDVPSSLWAHQAIQDVQTNGLMSGLPDGTFKPNQAITRAEMATIISRWQKLSGTGTSNATDIQNNWAIADIKRVNQAGFMQGLTPTAFKPNQPLTRAEAVTTLNRVLKLDKTQNSTTPWTDVPSTHWAKADIIAASSNYTITD